MAHPPVGVDEQSTRHTSTPKGHFVLRADSIRPYGWLARTGFLSGSAYQMVNSIPARGVSTTMTTEKVKESTDVNVARC